MASPNKKDELYDLLTLQSFKEECMAIISKYVHDKNDAINLYDAVAAELAKQKVDNVREMRYFVKAAMHYKAKIYFKQQLNNKETATNDFNEQPTTDFVFSHLRFAEIRNAVKLHRNELDFIIFELNSQGYSHREIAGLLNNKDIKEGAVRKRLCDVRKWIKRFFNEK